MFLQNDTYLQNLLTESQVQQFVTKRLHLQAEDILQVGKREKGKQVELLNKLVRKILAVVPFQNIMMLVRPRRPPTLDEIVSDMMEGRGGPCSVMNPFVGCLLSSLGFQVRFVSGTIKRPDCHIILVVRIEDEEFWVDAGNGHPYLEAISLAEVELSGFKALSHASLTFRLIQVQESNYELQHLKSGSWSCCYYFDSSATRSYEFFLKGTIQSSFTDPLFSPFLTGLRLIRYPEGEMVAIRDSMFYQGKDLILKMKSQRELREVFDKQFGDITTLPLEKALKILEECGHGIFKETASAVSIFIGNLPKQIHASDILDVVSDKSIVSIRVYNNNNGTRYALVTIEGNYEELKEWKSSVDSYLSNLYPNSFITFTNLPSSRVILPSRNRPIIAVVGHASLKPEERYKEELAEALGERLIDAGYRLMTGGLGGIMAAASRGAKKSHNYCDGDIIGILPGNNPKDANEYVDIAIPTTMEMTRNLIVSHSDGVIAIGGGAGTMSEISLAWTLKRLVLAFRIDGWSGKVADTRIDHRIRYSNIPEDKIFGIDSVEDAIRLLATLLPKYSSRYQGFVHVKGSL